MELTPDEIKFLRAVLMIQDKDRIEKQLKTLQRHLSMKAQANKNVGNDASRKIFQDWADTVFEIRIQLGMTPLGFDDEDSLL